MSKVTLLGLNRKFEKTEMGLIKKRVAPLQSPPNKEIACIACDKPMIVQYGQLAYWHKECRTKGRQKLRALM